MLIKFQIEKFVCLHRALRAIRYFELFKIRLKTADTTENSLVRTETQPQTEQKNIYHLTCALRMLCTRP